MTCPTCGEPLVTKYAQTTHTVAGRGARWQGTLVELIDCHPDAIYERAEQAYDAEDQDWFNALPTDVLTGLWALCTDWTSCPSWDDEVYDALAARGHFDTTEKD